MAKRKKKKSGLLGGGIGGAVVLIIVIAVVVTQVFMTPKASNIEDAYEGADYNVVLDGTFTSAISGLLSGLIGTAEIDHTISGSKEVDDDEYVSFTVFIFEETDDAKEYAEDAKENLDDDSDNTVIRRGKAVYTGSKKGSFKFRTAM